MDPRRREIGVDLCSSVQGWEASQEEDSTQRRASGPASAACITKPQTAPRRRAARHHSYCRWSCPAPPSTPPYHQLSSAPALPPTTTTVLPARPARSPPHRAQFSAAARYSRFTSEHLSALLRCPTSPILTTSAHRLRSLALALRSHTTLQIRLGLTTLACAPPFASPARDNQPFRSFSAIAVKRRLQFIYRPSQSRAPSDSLLRPSLRDTSY